MRPCTAVPPRTEHTAVKSDNNAFVWKYSFNDEEINSDGNEDPYHCQTWTESQQVL